MKKKYPDGVKAVIVNDQIADARNEALDDCWTITQNPLSDYHSFRSAWSTSHFGTRYH